MISHEDVQELKRVFDDRYVMQSDCDKAKEKINNKFAHDDKRIKLVVHQQTINNWLTGAIESGIVALLIKVFLGG